MGQGHISFHVRVAPSRPFARRNDQQLKVPQQNRSDLATRVSVDVLAPWYYTGWAPSAFRRSRQPLFEVQSTCGYQTFSSARLLRRNPRPLPIDSACRYTDLSPEIWEQSGFGKLDVDDSELAIAIGRCDQVFARVQDCDPAARSRYLMLPISAMRFILGLRIRAADRFVRREECTSDHRVHGSLSLACAFQSCPSQ